MRRNCSLVEILHLTSEILTPIFDLKQRKLGFKYTFGVSWMCNTTNACALTKENVQSLTPLSCRDMGSTLHLSKQNDLFLRLCDCCDYLIVQRLGKSLTKVNYILNTQKKWDWHKTHFQRGNMICGSMTSVQSVESIRRLEIWNNLKG